MIATNVPEILWRQTGRASIRTPSQADALSGRTNPTFEQEVVELGQLLGARDGLLLLQNIRVPRLLSPEQAATYLPCAKVLYHDDEGLLYDLRPCADG